MEPSRKQESIGFISSFGSLRLLPELLPGRPHKGRRWYLEAVCRETGRRENAKFSARPTRKQVHRFMSWAGEELRFSLYWAEI
ncbi:hypothetical protein vBKpnAMK2_00311 [Klebsiella phage vB_Kpn_AM_K2]